MVSSLSSFKGPSAEWEMHKATMPPPPQPLPWTLQQDYAYGPAVLRRVGVSYERGTPVLTPFLDGVLADGVLTVLVQGPLGRVGDAQGRAAVPPCTTRLLMSLQCDEYSTHKCCRANMAHITQSRPDAGLGFQVDFLETHQSFPFSLGSGS